MRVNRWSRGWVAVAIIAVIALSLIGLVSCRKVGQIEQASTGFGSLNVAGNVVVAQPTNAGTATPGLYVNNAGVGVSLQVADGGTPVWSVNNGGAISSTGDQSVTGAMRVAAATAVGTATPALVVNNAGVSQGISVQDGGTEIIGSYNGGGVKVSAPTAIGTAVPALQVDSAGVSNLIEARKATTPVFYVTGAGAVSAVGGVVVTGGGVLVNGTWAKVSAPTAIATTTPALVVDQAGVSLPLSIRKASTPVFEVAGSGDVTVPADVTGGNALAKSEISGLPRIRLVGIGTMANGTTNTVITDMGDSETPATDWTAIDADTVMSNDSTYFRQGTASLKMAVATTADATDGATNALGTGDQDWTDDESVGMWFYADTTLTAGDLTFVITDGGAGDTSVDFPAYSVANVWQWIEIDISGVATASKDVITDVSIELSAAGAAVAAGGAFNVYVDFVVKWDGAEEESLAAAILSDGVLSVTVVDATDTGATSVNLVEYTDYFVHYQSGNDAVVMITDQSGADKVGLVLIAY